MEGSFRSVRDSSSPHILEPFCLFRAEVRAGNLFMLHRGSAAKLGVEFEKVRGYDFPAKLLRGSQSRDRKSTRSLRVLGFPLLYRRARSRK